MKIYSYNVNGIRAAVNKGLVAWLAQENPDIICFQEIKANDEDIPKALFEELGYKTYWYSAQKKGYSGTAILSKIEPNEIIIGCNHELYDFEGRVISLAFDNFYLVNTYFPSGSSGDIRQDIKMEFLDFYYDYIQQINAKYKNVIVVGDYNIAHTEIDIHDPKGNKNSSGFLPEERAWMDKWFGGGMQDSFRLFHPEKKDIYSWWTYRAGARPKNKGWRIDYISVSDSLKKELKSASIHNEAEHSDHCPISIEIF
jgi:exodeoxyribonuclease-3